MSPAEKMAALTAPKHKDGSPVNIVKPDPTAAEAQNTAPKSAMDLELEKLRAEVAALKAASAKAAPSLSLKVSDKGAVSLYGMGRFPVSLYSEQWLKVLDMADTIRAFIKANESNLKGKLETDEQYLARRPGLADVRAEKAAKWAKK